MSWRPGPGSLHTVLRPILLTAQCLGLLPVTGSLNPDPTHLRFTWKSWKVVYSIFLMVITFLVSVLSLVRMFITGISLFSAGNFIFYTTGFSILFFFFKMSMKWPEFMRQWTTVENKITGNKSYSLKMYILTTVFLAVALLEHIAANLTTIVRVMHCASNSLDAMKFYYLNAFNQVFSIFPYDPFIGICCSIIILIITLAWNFMDLFIMLMSIAMTTNFHNFNYTLNEMKGKNVHTNFWRKCRESYNELTDLTRKLDELLSPILLISFGTNLYYICWQLYNDMKSVHSLVRAIYLTLSFGLLLFRAFAVSLYAADLHQASKMSLSNLFLVPTESYNVEVERLINQMTSDNVALTGCNFFSVTRGLILTVAGTIITYEIILVQLNSSPTDNNDPNNTSPDCTIL